MPNTPVVVRNGVTIYSLGSKVRDGDKNLVDYLLSSVGVCHEMDEYYMDVITGLTGCGPSYVSCYSNAIYTNKTSTISQIDWDGQKLMRFLNRPIVI